MRLGKVKKLLMLWKHNNLISIEQSEKIMDFMKIERNRQFLRLVKWLFILGAFWLAFGVLAALKLLNLDILVQAYELIKHLLIPIKKLMKFIFGVNYIYAYYSFISLLVWALLFYFGIRRKNKSELPNLKLNYLHESHLKATTSLFVLSYIAAGLSFNFLNRLLLPSEISYYYSDAKIFPLFTFVGIAFFLYIAYRLKDQIALLFGIYFIAMSLGCVSGYEHACYWLGVPLPMVQLLTSIILVLIGFIHVMQSKGEDFKLSFGRIYQWTGLLLGFIALWIMSLWGITKGEEYWSDPSAAELWLSNILFIAAGLGSMAYGAKSDDKMFFNYGLTFLIIATYTIFFSHLWSNMGTAIGALCLGGLLMVTGHVLRNYWIKRNM